VADASGAITRLVYPDHCALLDYLRLSVCFLRKCKATRTRHLRKRAKNRNFAEEICGAKSGDACCLPISETPGPLNAGPLNKGDGRVSFQQ
jgi:hypothetical protein